jgi:preprotein translocase subunit SecG
VTLTEEFDAAWLAVSAVGHHLHPHWRAAFQCAVIACKGAGNLSRGTLFDRANLKKSDLFMQTVLIVIHLMVVLALVGVVLLQRSEGGGLGIGGGSGFMTARGAANALTRSTAILGAAFFATSLLLSLLASYGDKPTDILDKVPAAQQSGEGGVLKQLGGKDIPSADVPAAPPADPAAKAPAALKPAAPAASDNPAPAASGAALPLTPEAPASSTDPKPAAPPAN